jgi:hypothetical protein
MTEKDFAISSIELSHEQAISLYQRIIEAIENYGVQNFNRKTEIQVPELTEDDLIKVYVELEIFTEADDNIKHPLDYPEPEEILQRSVDKLKIQLVNRKGSDVVFEVLGERKMIDNISFYTASPFDIDEKIKQHFYI